MATNIDKALYQQPKGIETLAQDEEPIEIEIIDPEEVNIHAGSMELSIRPGEDEDTFGQNLAEELTESELTTLAGELSEDITNDLAHAVSRRSPTCRASSCWVCSTRSAQSRGMARVGCSTP